jgi:FemAB-related protein (PEP-CTERM system-associated)
MSGTDQRRPSRTAVRIVDLDATGGAGADPAAWDAFVESCPEATFFHRAAWRTVVGRVYGHDCYYRMAVADGAIRGVLPLIHVRSPLFGSSLISTAFTVGGGIAALDAQAREALAADAQWLAQRLGVGVVELRGERADLSGWAVNDWRYATFRGPLAGDDDAILKAIPRKKRADVRKALKADLTIATEPDPADFHALYARSLRDLGTPVFGRRWVAALLDAFGGDVEMSLVAQGRTPLAALLSFRFKDTVLPYYAGATPEARKVHAFDLMYYDLMCRAARASFGRFDFGRSKRDTGAFAYKTFWGFEPTPLAYQYHLPDGGEVPERSPANPKYRRAVQAWRRLPLWAANRIGPVLAGHLG